MKSSKSLAPSSKEAPSSNLQAAAGEFGAGPWWEVDDGLLVLNDEPALDGKPPFDLEERTAQFGEAVIKFAKTIPRHPANDRIINQVVGAGTSVGANYCEANESVSKKDFRYSISRCIKEAKESRFFLRMAVASEPQLVGDARKLWREATELLRIFSTMKRK